MAKNRSHLYMMTKKKFYNKLHTHTIQLIFFRGRDFIELPEGLFFNFANSSRIRKIQSQKMRLEFSLKSSIMTLQYMK